MNSNQYHYDVIVVGAGHAGTEAAAAAARMGAHTAMLTTNLDTVGQMSCNPAIGGVAKGHLVREIDALGGLMGRAIDATGIQFRMLNMRKGPAMHSPRAQADKREYQHWIKCEIERQENLDLRQEIVEDLLTESTSDGEKIIGVRVKGGFEYRAPTVILTTGTFLSALMHTDWDLNWRDSKLERLRGSTVVRSTTTKRKFNRVTKTHNRFRFFQKTFQSNRFLAGSRTPTRMSTN